jgi:hypothetical protein
MVAILASLLELGKDPLVIDHIIELIDLIRLHVFQQIHHVVLQGKYKAYCHIMQIRLERYKILYISKHARHTCTSLPFS